MWLYESQKKYDLALKQYQKTLLLNNQLGGAYYHMGVIYYKQLNMLQAELNFKKALEKKYEFGELYNYLGLVFEKKNDFFF